MSRSTHHEASPSNADRAAPPQWLLLHGTPLSPAVWDATVRALTADDTTATCPDLNGLVATSATPDLQNGLARRLATTLPSARYHVVGHSFGGQVALELALVAPQMVDRLTLMCTRDSPYPPFADAAAVLRTDSRPDTDAALSRWFRPSELALGGPVVSYARQCLDDADRVTWAATLDAIAVYDRTDRIGALDMPVTVIAAEHDQVSTPSAMWSMADRLPSSTRQLLPDAAHLSPFIDPVALAALLTWSEQRPRHG